MASDRIVKDGVFAGLCLQSECREEVLRMSIGEKIAAARKAKGWSQEQLGYMLDFGLPDFRQIEGGFLC